MEKFARNVERDTGARSRLADAGWRVAVVWECALRPPHADATVASLVDWIGGTGQSFETPVIRTRA